MPWRACDSKKVARPPSLGQTGKLVDVLTGRKPVGKSSHTTDNAIILYVMEVERFSLGDAKV